MLSKINYKLLKYLSLLLTLSLYPHLILAQEVDVDDDLVRWTPEGMEVFVSDAALSEDMPEDGRVQAVVYRRLADNEPFEEIARVQRAENWEEFTQRASTGLIEGLLNTLELETEEELWEFIKENPNMEGYGFLAFNRNFWRAFGTAYLDSEAVQFREGQSVTYEVRHIMEDGSESEMRFRGTAIVGELPNILPPQSISRVERDSLVGVRWAAPIEGSEDAFFGHVYRQTEEGEEFEQLPGRIMAQRSDSLIIYQWEESVEPEHSFRYFVQPLDIAGIPGPRSDTLSVISVNFENLPLMSSVSARDTTSGIHLSWEPVEYKPYLTGIEIQRSRQADRGYIVLDTLSVQETEFLDTNLVPNRNYYYRFRIVTIRELNDLPSAVASASFRNTEIPPSTPSALQAEQEGDGIRLHWDSVEEPDLFGYYVYRGTSRHDSMAVVSRAIRDTTTFLDRSEELDGRTNYVYAVRAVNMSDMESELSNMVVARPNRLVRPPAPIGIEGYAEQSRIRLSWRNEQRRDGAIAGYHLYRTTSQPGRYPEGESASVQAEQAGFERINDEILTTTSFDDINVNPGETYYYALSTEDHFGVESTLSEARRFRSSPASLLPPSQVSARTVTGGVEIRWNRTLQQDVENYRIYKRARGEENPSVIGTVSSETTRFTDDEVTEETLYWYSVSVVRGEQESSRGREQSVSVR